MLKNPSSRQSLVPVNPILPSNPFTFCAAKAVSRDQQDHVISDRMKADADPGGIKTERRDNPQTKNDADNQIQLRPRPERKNENRKDEAQERPTDREQKPTPTAI